MNCPKCDLPAIINSYHYKIKQEDGKTKLYIEQIFKCRNQKCVNYEQEVGTDETYLQDMN